jgi:Tfp pilus assembly PilM family ATPase
MSAFGGAALGIDVSDGTLKAVRLSRRGGRLILQHTWRLEIAERPDAELEALRALVQQARPGPGTRIVISAPTRGLFSRTYTLPAMSGERVAELVRYEVLASCSSRPTTS